MRSITIIHPSRSRAELAIKVADKWTGNAHHPDNIKYLFSIDSTDPHKEKYLASEYNCIVSNNTTAIQAINNAASETGFDILIVVSDDFDCFKDWDLHLLKAIGDKTDFVAKTKDGLQSWIITLPIMDSVYYNRFGYVYNPKYQHMFCDTEMTCVADMNGRKINIDLMFRHLHYTQANGIKKDAVSFKNDKTWQQGEQLFLSRYHSNFNMSDSEIVGKLHCDNTYRKWLSSKGLKIA